MILILVLLISALSAAAQTFALHPDKPAVCGDCADWNRAHAPFHIYGNTDYVGTAGLSSLVVKTNHGLVLFDGALPQSAPLIVNSIRALGLDPRDVRYILVSHTHFDHAGGVAALQRATGARVVSSLRGAAALRLGHPTPDDPQADQQGFATVHSVRTIADHAKLRLGNVEFTAHYTPGHTPGGMTWTWQSCEADRCLHMVYADSLTALSTVPGFRFSGDATHPDLVPRFQQSIATIAALPCDILFAPHPGSIAMDDKLRLRQQHPAEDPFIDTSACKRYAESAAKHLDERIAQENPQR